MPRRIINKTSSANHHSINNTRFASKFMSNKLSPIKSPATKSVGARAVVARPHGTAPTWVELLGER